MADVKVISVNPGIKTVGALNFEFIGKVARTCSSPVSKAVNNQRVKKVCNHIFGIDRSSTDVEATKLLLIRVIAAVFLVALGITGLDPVQLTADPDINIFNIVIGCMILSGLFTRIASICGFLLYAFLVASQFYGLGSSITATSGSATPDLALICMSMIFLFLAITGPGRYCIDQLLRMGIVRIAERKSDKRSQRKNLREAEARMSYKAWREA